MEFRLQPVTGFLLPPLHFLFVYTSDLGTESDSSEGFNGVQFFGRGLTEARCSALIWSQGLRF